MSDSRLAAAGIAIECVGEARPPMGLRIGPHRREARFEIGLRLGCMAYAASVRDAMARGVVEIRNVDRVVGEVIAGRRSPWAACGSSHRSLHDDAYALCLSRRRRMTTLAASIGRAAVLRLFDLVRCARCVRCACGMSGK